MQRTYFAAKAAGILLATTLLPSTASSQTVFNPVNGSHYRVFNTIQPWQNADSLAKAIFLQGRRGHLVTINDQAEQEFIVANLQFNRTWIGLSQNRASLTFSEPAGGFQWVDGQPLAFSNFARREPNNGSTGEGFVEMNGNGKWNDRVNAPTNVPPNAFIVEWDPQTHFHVGSRKFYQLISDSTSWTKAKKAAESMTFLGKPGRLVTIRSRQENEFLRTRFNYDRAWIGLFQNTASPRFSEPAGGFEWVDGRPLTFSNFEPGEPNNIRLREDFVEIASDGLWNDKINSPTVVAPDSYFVEFGPFAAGRRVVFNPANGSHYMVVNDAVSWKLAKSRAGARLFRGQKGHLATITSQAEQNFILANLNYSKTWIGLFQNTASSNFTEPAGGFEWVTGETSEFFNFAPGEPNNKKSREDFIEMFRNGTWNDAIVNPGNSPPTSYIVEWSNSGVVASATVRNGQGINPVGFAQVTPSVIGTKWQTTVDLTSSGATSSLLILGSGPTSGLVLPFGELLCLTPTVLDASRGTHSIPIPNDQSLLGATVCTQAAAVGTFGLQLQNALDIIIGSF